MAVTHDEMPQPSASGPSDGQRSSRRDLWIRLKKFWVKLGAFKLWVKLGAVLTALAIIGSIISGIADGKVLLFSKGPDPTIKIDAPENLQTVPRCIAMRGTAPRLKGKELWEAHHAGDGQYYFNRPAREDSDRWRLMVTLGAANEVGFKYQIDFFYISEGLGHFLSGVGALGGVAAFAKELPPGAEYVVSRTVTRETSSAIAKCN